MKPLILAILCACAFNMHAQWKINSSSIGNFDEFGVHVSYDSIRMTYNSPTQGTLTSFSPRFSWDFDFAPIWGFSESTLSFNSAELYSGNAPTNATLIQNANQTFNNQGYIATSTSHNTGGIPLYKVLYNYNLNGNLIEQITQYYDGTFFVNYLKVNYSFDSQNRVIRIAQIDYFNGPGTVTTLDSFYYAPNNLINKRMRYVDIGNGIEPYYKSIATIVGNKYLNVTIDSYDNQTGVFEPFFKYSYTYGGTLVNGIDVGLYDGAGSYTTVMNYDYTFTNGDLTKIDEYFYGSLNSSQEFNYFIPWFVNKFTLSYESSGVSTVRKYHYTAGTVGLENNKEIFMTIFPNPSSDNIHLKTDEIIRSCKIYNALGQLVIQQTGDSKIIDINPLSKGTYGVTIDTENGVITKSFVKE